MGIHRTLNVLSSGMLVGATLTFTTIFFGSLFVFANAPQTNGMNIVQHRSEKEQQDSDALTARAAGELGASFYTEIEFQPGSKQLTASSRRKIDDLFARAQEKGKIRGLTVLSWSDEEYPAASQTLPARERELADERNKAVEDYVTSARRVDADSYNMAERPSSVRKFFNTMDTQLKQDLVAGGLPTTADERQYPSKASHSVVLLTLE